MQISFIIPSRNNLKYLKWGYEAIQKNKGNHDVELCYADDASTDGTWEWLTNLAKNDSNVKIYKNTGPDRVGHTILYDKLVNDFATNEICMIYHADMYLCPGALDAIENEMYTVIDAGDNGTRTKNEKRIISLTRIEPPLHPDGPEKILWDGGVEPEEFKEQELLDKLPDFKFKGGHRITCGIFAPWAFWKKDFQEIGGHDPLYRPQSKEDSDIFNRFQLNGIDFLQTWEGFVYHMTCRGSRRNTADKAKNIYEDSPEWLAQNMRSTRNFIRKWGHFVKHDQWMKPIIPNKYNIGIRLKNGNLELLEALEPWCDRIYTEERFNVIGNIYDYIEKEQGNTDFDLTKRVHSLTGENDKFDYDDIVIEIDGKNFTQQDMRFISEISTILDSSELEIATFEIGNLKLTINHIETYTKDLINLKGAAKV